MAPIQVTILQENDLLHQETVDSSAKVNDFLVTLAEKMSCPSNAIQLLFNDSPLDGRTTLTAAGVQDGDLLRVARKPQPQVRGLSFL